MAHMEKISLSEAKTLLSCALMAQEVSREHSESVANALVAAEAEGQAGHGFSRLGDYVAQVRSGKINRDANIASRLTSQTAISTDADFGFAYPALDHAISEGICVARSYGTATMSIKNSHHAGALSVQVEKLAAEGLVGLMFANAPPAIAPWGAASPVFGTNPIAFAAPRRAAPPLVIDLALSHVARGKVMHARKTGQPIPPDWAFDKDGQPTTDPAAALAGSMAPAGGAKGTVLALMVEVLASVFTGANPSLGVASFFDEEGPSPGSGQFLIAMSPSNLGAFTDRLEMVLTAIDSLEGARLPGDRRANSISRAQAHGIAVPGQYLDLARELARANF
ncbi:MAG: Ldh family oxidoreductase [Arenibacterium sp.]